MLVKDLIVSRVSQSIASSQGSPMTTASSKLGNQVLAAGTRTEEGWLVLSEQDDDDDDEDDDDEEEEEGHCHNSRISTRSLLVRACEKGRHLEGTEVAPDPNKVHLSL